jgi:hypothetical protein
MVADPVLRGESSTASKVGGAHAGMHAGGAARAAGGGLRPASAKGVVQDRPAGGLHSSTISAHLKHFKRSAVSGFSGKNG